MTDKLFRPQQSGAVLEGETMISVPGFGKCLRGMLMSALLLAGCHLGPVMIDGVPVARVAHRFEGNPYSIRHYDAHPRLDAAGALGMEEGGRITGVVCGTDIEYTVEHMPGYQRLIGSIESQHLSELKVRSGVDGLSIVGKVGPKEVRLWFTQQYIEGYLGRCPVRMILDPLDEAEDKLVQYVQARGERMRVELYGVHSLWKMPAADQAAVMPMMLLCVQAQVLANLDRGQTPPLGFGGPLGAVPKGSLPLEGGIGSYRDCGAREYL